MRNLRTYINIFLPRFLAVALLLVVACDDEERGTPVITNVRLTHPETQGMALTAAPLGVSIVVQGSNLGGTRQLFLNDYSIILNPVYVTDNNIVVTIPDQVPTVATNPNVPNTLRIVDEGGYEVTFPFETLPPPAIIESVSNEMADAGETITLTGKYFFFVNGVIFPGDVLGTDVSTSADGTSLTVTVPAGVRAGGGHIYVASNSGVSSKTPRSQFNNMTGTFMNFDDLNPFGWGIPSENITDVTPGGVIKPLDSRFGLINTVLTKNYGWANAKVIDITYWGAPMFPTSISGYDEKTPIANMDLRMEVAVEKPINSLDGIVLLVWYPMEGDANDKVYSYTHPLRESVKSLDGKWYTVSIPMVNLVTSAGKKISTYGQMLDQTTHEIRLVVNNATADDIEGVIAIDNIRIVNNTL